MWSEGCTWVEGPGLYLPKHASHCWKTDPKRLMFSMSRYKFVSKMLSGLDSVLEIGCGDGFLSHIVAQEVGHLTAVDSDPVFMSSASDNSKRRNISFSHYDFLRGPLPEVYEAFYCLDVLEHICPENEFEFLQNAVDSLHPYGRGIGIIGCPTLESQKYASEFSKKGHVNCKTQADLKIVLEGFFRNVFMFSMNDEVLHTGFGPMAHYSMAVCCR